jgi:hypothetical protein
VSTVASYRHEIAERSRAGGSAAEIGTIPVEYARPTPRMARAADSLDEAKAAFRAAGEAGA